MRSMRVTVCFGQTRVIVPCKGGATVAELVKEACARYKKAIGKGPKYWVKIRQLENAVDGGILDVDDYVYDVAEDRDQLIAVFDEEDDQTYNHHNGWDRQSGSSSDGRRSPVYHRYPSHSNRYNKENQSVDENKGRPQQTRHGRDSEHEVNVGADTLKSVSGSLSLITVRRGSDLMLNKPESKVCDGMQNMSDQPGRHYGRRESGSGQEEDSSPASAGHRQHLNSFSSAVAGSPEADISGVTTSSDASNGAEGASHSARKKPQSTNFSNFVRDSTRQSIMGMLAEKSEDEIDSVGTDFRSSETRQPPDGRKGTSNHKDFNGIYKTGYNVERYLPPPPNREVKLPWFYNDTQEMFIEIDDRPLGVQVVSHKENKVFSGLLVKSVDSGGRSEREGLLQQGDIIVEINNYILVQYVLPVAQEIFKNAMKFPELQLRVYPVEERERVAHEKREEMNKALNGHRHTPSIPLLSVVEATPPKTSGLSSAKSLPNLSDTHSSKSVQSSDFSPDGKIPLAARISLDTLSNNTRKIGNMFEIELRKGQQGLGFSITTRDTPVGDPGPIYIKNILPKGAAIQDGRLRAGDRLLKVNDVEMTGHTQESAVHILRCIDVGSLVNIVVSRHVSTLPRKMKDDPAADEVVRDDAHREYFMFEIALNDTGSAGLGISLKGNQSKKTKQDLGIFVKAVFHGGAAYQDGRLRPNDQLVSVNGQSLIGMTNHEAIDTLRVSMSTVGNVRGMIQMVIARRKLINGNPTSPQFSSEASSELSDSLMNDRNSRSSSRGSHARQSSVPSARRPLSPILAPEHCHNRRSHHGKQISELSLTSSSVFSTSLGDDADWYGNDEMLHREIQSYLGGTAVPEMPEDTYYIPRSSRVMLSPSRPSQPNTSIRRHSSMRSNRPTVEQRHVAHTINRYTQSTPVHSQPQPNIIGDLMRSVAVDNHYKPRPLPRSTTPNRNLRNPRNNEGSLLRPPARSNSMRGHRRRDANDAQRSKPRHSSERTTGVGCASPAFRKDESSPFDNMTAFEITGHSREKYSADDSFQYNEEVPRQIDPNPLDPYGSSAFERDSPDHKGDWPPSPDPQDSDLDPFSRESIFRQSISEKRKGAAAQNTDTFKSAKSKQSNSEIVKKKPQPEIKNTPPASPLKWVKPSNAKNHHHSSSTTPARKTNSTPVKSPRSTGRNLNNSSNLPATTTRPKAASIDEGKSQEHKRSATPRSFEHRSETPSTLSLASVESPPFSSKSTTADNGVFPPDNPALSETLKSSKTAMKQSHIDSLRTTKAVPVVKKSNSSESLVTYGIYSKQVPVPAIPGSPSASPAKDATNRAMPHLKPAVLPYTDIKHLAACCTPLSVGGLAQREISPAYDRRHPLTARREEHVRPAVEVGPTLGIAKSSSLESLQTAVENFESGQDMHYPRPKPRVLRGRVMNDSFRAALDQSYGLENVDGRPMATRNVNEENTTLSPLVPSDDSPQNSRSRSTDKRRAGKSYRLFGLFKVGKGKRSMSTDRNLDSVSSTSSSPRVAENEAHKRLLESKREDDYKKHQAETERIQAKAKAMREQQEQRKRNEEKYKSCDDLLGTKDERVRAPSVPVTAMQRVNIDPKVSYAEAPTGRRSVDPIAMRNAQPTTFEWNTKKRPTSPVNYARPGRTKASEKETAISKVKASPDYRSLPRQPRLESQKAGKVPDRSNGVVTKSAGGSHAASPSPTSPANPTENRVTQLAANFDNYEFYNKQKPPATGQRKSAGARTQKPPTAHPRSATVGAPVVAERQGRALKAGRTLYYDDTDSSVSPSSTLRGRGAEVHARPAQNTAPRRPQRGDNGIDMSSSGRSFQRMESPEPPPVTHRRSLYTPTANPRPAVGAREHAADKASYRHSVHVDAAGHTDVSGRRTPNNLNQRKRTDGTHFLWKPKGHSSSSDNSSYRTSSPASSGTKEQNRNAYKKMLRARYDERENPGKIVISPAYNL